MVKRIWRPVCALLMLSLAWPCQAGADTLLCPGGVVSTGDRMSQVKVRCGEPLSRESYLSDHAGVRVYDRYGRSLARLTPVEEWTYHVSDLDRFLLFENGILVKIIYNP